MRFYEQVTSPLGKIYLIFSGKTLIGLRFTKPRMRAGKAPDSFKSQLRGYFEGTVRQFDQETLFTSGTDFEKKVWLAIREIPFGQTRTYKWVAQEVDSPNASRAVGQALSKNPISIVFPCHRVIESDGDLGGYSGGEDIKRRLLALEYYHARAAESRAR